MDGTTALGLAGEPWTQKLISKVARRLCRGPWFDSNDQEDIEQELQMHLWCQAHRYDPSRGTVQAFARMVIKFKVRMLLRKKRRRQGGAPRSMESLDRNTTLCDEDRVPIAAIVTSADHCRRAGREPDDPLADMAVQDATAHVLGTLPPHQTPIASQLMLYPVATVARKVNTSRRQVRNVRDILRERFALAGFNGPDQPGHPTTNAA